MEKSSPKGREIKGDTLQKNEDPILIERRSRAALEADPDDQEALDDLGHALWSQYRYGEAAKCFEKQYEVRGAPDVTLFTRIAKMYIYARQLDEAEKWTAMVLHQDPHNPVALMQNSQISLRRKKPAEARQFLYEIKNPKERAFTMVAKTFLAENNLAKARLAAEKAVTFKRDVAGVTLLGSVCEREGKYVEAQKLYSEALSLAPSDAHVRYLLARSCFLSGDIKAVGKTLSPLMNKPPIRKEVLLLFSLTIGEDEAAYWEALKDEPLYEWVKLQVDRYRENPAAFAADTGLSGLEENTLWDGEHVQPINGQAARSMSDHEEEG